MSLVFQQKLYHQLLVSNTVIFAITLCNGLLLTLLVVIFSEGQVKNFTEFLEIKCHLPVEK